MEFLEEFQNPQAKYRIKPFWFWNGDITREEISHQIREMADKGLGGAFICARQGMTVPYLSKEWFDLVEYACEEAKSQGLEVWLYDEYPYPSGMSGGEVLLEHPEAEHMVLRHRRFFGQGGTVIEEELGWSRVLWARAYRIRESGETDWEDSLDVSAAVGTLQTEKIYQQTGLTNYNNKRFFSYGPKKILKTVLPEGNWRLEIYTEEALGDFKYYGGFFDPCNSAAVHSFLETTHERYQSAVGNRFGKEIHGMFSDEVGLLSPIPWSKILPEEFEKRNGYPLPEWLPALHDDQFPGAFRFRFEFYQTIHELFRDSYHKQVSEWCKDHGLSYATEVPSMRLSTQKYSDIIGGDTAHEKLGKSLDWIYEEYIKNYRSNAKAVSSLARQLDKAYAMIESFHSVGWSMTLQDAKWMIDRLGCSGINFYNFHAFYYTIQDITKHDAPPSQFLQNPYWKFYRKLADYVGRMGMLITNTEADIKIGVLDPAAALWTRLGNPFQGFPYAGESPEERELCDSLRKTWVHICKTLLTHQLDYDHLDGELLMDAAVQNGKLKLGRAAYQVVILPPCHCMEMGVRKKLEEFVSQGGCLIGFWELPHVGIDSDETDAVTRERWQQLFRERHSHRIQTPDWEEELIRLCHANAPQDPNITVLEGNARDVIASVRLDQEGNHYVFTGNQGAGKVALSLSLPENQSKETSAIKYNLETGETIPMQKNGSSWTVHLGQFESQWTKLSGSQEIKEEQTEPKERLAIPMNGTWKVRPEGNNICRFAEVSLSLDQKDWRETEVKTFLEQCEETSLLSGDALSYCGTFGTPKTIVPAYPLKCSYRMEFEIEIMPSQIYLMMDQEAAAGKKELFVNGQPVKEETFQPFWINDSGNQAAQIRELVVEGRNEIMICITAEKDEDGLRDPVYLLGDFGVFRGEKAKIRLSRLPDKGEPDRGWWNGFPYYSGTMSWEKSFDLEELMDDIGEKRRLAELGEKLNLTLDFAVPRYDCMEVAVNGQELGVKAYTPYSWSCDRAFLKERENIITVKITTPLSAMLDGTWFEYEGHRLVKVEP